MGQEFKKIGARFDFRLRAPLMCVCCCIELHMYSVVLVGIVL